VAAVHDTLLKDAQLAAYKAGAIIRADENAGGAPILALDMYEHSYHIDFGAKAADYVGTFMAAINWPAVRGAYDGVRS
jgi:superoxide dismutase